MKIATGALALVFILNALDASAMQVLNASNDAELNAVIAKDELNRIKVIADRITYLRSNEGALEVLDDPKLGEAYIRLPQSSDNPLNIFINTEKGYTYKLLLVPKSIPSEQIFIKNNGLLESVEEVNRTELIKLIKGMRAGIELDGYTKAVEEEGQKVDEYVPRKIESYNGNELVGEIYEIRGNRGFNREDFITPKTIAMSVDDGERIKVYMVRGKS